MPDVLTAPAPAKVNLVLEVLGRRDDGYHEIDTVLQTLELADRVTVALGAEAGLAILGPFAAGTPGDASNLALRAVDALRELSIDVPPVRIELEKRIPAAGGLGGGASDAATVIRLLQQRLGFPEDVAHEAANAIGSDEAAFLVGGTVRATGRGETVRRLADLARHSVVLFIPPDTIASKTARLFAALDETSFDDGAVARRFAAATPSRFDAADVYNAFERVAFDVFPGLGALHRNLEQRTGEPIRLAGAGPTLFSIGPPDRAEAVAASADGAACTTVITATAGSLWKR